ncbi:MAG TPA: response regulator [Flavobacterium sp.]|uniref:response regulator n=1 Tax=Flavobacterium sp. TaxID=239 RepID=UPI002DBE35F5|nr:response regulator [Flavobacterium sp.]HEU4788352.1 response regulator [Flavobacterium sp.]
METKYAFLVIEDNQIDQFITRQLFKKMLDISDINIANNGKEGIKWVCDNRKKINEALIILLDIQMPIMNGIQFLLEYEKLEDELKRETQIFMVSSSLDSDEIKHLKGNIHVTDFLSKPICVKEFSKRIYAEF